MNLPWNCHDCSGGTLTMPRKFHGKFMAMPRSKNPYFSWHCRGNLVRTVAFAWQLCGNSVGKVRHLRGNCVAVILAKRRALFTCALVETTKASWKWPEMHWRVQDLVKGLTMYSEKVDDQKTLFEKIRTVDTDFCATSNNFRGRLHIFFRNRHFRF